MSATAATGPTDMSETPSPTSSGPPRTPPTKPAPVPPKAPTPPGRLTWLAYATRAGLAVGAVIVGLMAFMALEATKSPPGRSDLGSSAMRVLTLQAEQRQVSRVWEGFGTARPMSAADVRAEVGGTVIERPDAIEAGAKISEGDTIIKIEPMDYEQRVTASEKRAEALQAQLSGLEIEEERLRAQERLAMEEEDAARRDFQRVREAIEAGAGSSGELDQFEATLLRSQRTLEAIRQLVGLIPSRRLQLEAQLLGERAALRVERENLIRTVVTSPIDGVLQTIDFERGEWVGASQRVARVVDLSRIEIPLRLPKSAGGSVKIGDRVELRSDGPIGQEWAGTIVRIAPEVDAGTRTLEAFVEVLQDTSTSERPLLPGQFVVGRVWTSETSSRIVLPRRAVVADRVLLAEPIPSDDPALVGYEGADTDALARVRPMSVRVDYHLGGSLTDDETTERDWAVLQQGSVIPEGSSVILSNLDQLIEGMIVRVSTGQDANDPAPETGTGGD